MKRTVIHPDGRIEIIEGTPAELASNEKAQTIGEVIQTKQKKRVIRG